MKKFLLFILSLYAMNFIHAQDIESDLVAHFQFCGDLSDESGNNNQGEFVGDGTLTFGEDHFGNSNSALLLNGINQYINVPSSESLDSPVEEVTVALWFNYTSAFNGWIVPLTKTNSLIVADRQYGFGINDGTGMTYMNTYYVGSYSYEPNTWYHGAITYTENEYRFYINGELIQSGVPEDPIVQNNQPLEIGRDVPSATEYYNGMIDEIRIYSRALTENEINMVMNADGCNSNSISENQWTGNVDIYPNPATDFIHFSFDRYSEERELSIYNSLGQHILTKEIKDVNNQIKLSELKNGLYQILIKGEEGVYRKSVLKE